MKIKVLDPVVSASWSYRKGDVVDTETNDFINEQQAISWLNAGVAEIVKEPAKKGKREATVKKTPAEVS